MRHNSRGGFLPLTAIILIAFVIAAGTTAAVVINHRKAENQPQPTAAPTPDAVVGPVSDRVATSSPGTTAEPDRRPEAVVETRVATKSEANGLTAEEIARDRREREEAVARRKARAEAVDEELRQAIAEHRAIAEASTNYDREKCERQKRSLVPQADATYLRWWDDYQEARASLNSCYDTNSVPVCDKKMTDLNVAWQAKLDTRLEPLYDKLTSCPSGEREFASVSTVVSAGR